MRRLSAPWLTAAALVAASFVCLLIHLSIGSFEASLGSVLMHLIVNDGGAASFAVRELRLPRALTAFLVGASLALSGAIIQAITRNPLGDPGLTGVTAGATFGVAVMVSFITQATGPMIGAGIIGGVMAASVTLLLARRSGLEPVQLIVSGIAVSILFTALTSAVMIIDRASTQTLYFWLIGGFANRTWVEAAHLAPWVFGGALLAFAGISRLDMLVFQDLVARALGVNTAAWRLAFGVVSIILVAAPVAVAGPISFVGFLAPHVVRTLLPGRAAKHEVLLPLSALMGGFLTLFADTLSRGLPLDRTPPAGAIVAVFGGIIFLFLSRRLIRNAA